MPKKRPHHVPEWHDVKPNRTQRRHPEGRPEDQPLARDEQQPPVADSAPKHGHKKPAAERWSE
jgi:hypothetical protein